MQKQQLIRNATMSALQIVIISGTLFVLYRFLLRVIGVEHLGIWSLVLASTSTTRIANFGISASVVKFVAKYVARNESANVSHLLQTASISIALFSGIVLFLSYPTVKIILGFVISREALPVALTILPHAFFALWITIITSIFQSGLDGYQRIDIKSYLMIGGTVAHLILCLIFTPKYGLLGLAYANILRNFLILIGCWLFLKKLLPSLPAIPHHWCKKLFKEIIGYGVNFQVITITSMLYEPITKTLLSKFGGLAMVGYYEMASRMVQQIRAIIISANQVLVPAIADLQEKFPRRIKSVYLSSYQLLFYLTLPIFALIVVLSPVVSKFWIGSYNNIFVYFSILLSIGWSLNTLTGPAYFAYLGIGILRWNVTGHIIIALLNITLGYLLGSIYGGNGVVVAWIVSLVSGSSLIYLSYHKANNIVMAELMPKANRFILLVCSLAVILATIQYKIMYHKNDSSIVNIIFPIVLTMIVLVLSWFHPMRKRLIKWLTNTF